MPTSDPATRFRSAFVLLLALAVTAAFLLTIQGFLMSLLVAVVLTGLCRPIDRRLLKAIGARPSASAALTVLSLTLFLFVPMFLLAVLVAGQALEISETAQPWVTEQLASRSGPDAATGLVLPEILQPYEPRIIEKAGELAGSIGGFLVGALAHATRGTVTFIFLSFVTLYATFFFLRDGQQLLDRLLRVMPLSPEHEERMVAQFLSVSRATVKGTLVIGIVQGGLAGLAFAIAGIGGAAFWGVVMAVLSIIPGLGTAVIWVPAVIYLLTTGQTVAGIALAIWCGAVVGTADNVLRPTLVGRDTQMPDLLILLSTLGGLMLFGAVGIVVGPLVAALFMTVWDIYLETFDAYLPAVAPAVD